MPSEATNLLLADRGRLRADSCIQRRHLHRRQGRLESLVAHLQPRPVDGLLQSLTGKDAEGVRHARLLRRLPNAARDFIDDHVVMRGVAAEQAAKADDGVILFRLRQRPCRGRNFKRPRHTDDLDVFLFRTRAQKPVISTLQKSLCDESVETRNDDRETFSGRVQAAGEAAQLGFGMKPGAVAPVVVVLRDSAPPW